MMVFYIPYLNWVVEYTLYTPSNQFLFIAQGYLFPHLLTNNLSPLHFFCLQPKGWRREAHRDVRSNVRPPAEFSASINGKSK